MLSNSINFHHFMPDEVWRWKQIEQQIEQDLLLHDYQEIRLSVLEDYDLLRQGISAFSLLQEGADYQPKTLRLCSPNEDVSLITLRPEGTISVLRNSAAHLEEESLTRLYYMGPMFRFDSSMRPMEFYQLGVELLGSDSVLADSEVMSLGIRLCKSLNLGDVALRLNNFGCQKCRLEYFEAIKQYLKQHKKEYCASCWEALQAKPFEASNCNDPQCSESLAGGPKITDYLCEECQKNFSQIKKIQANLGHSYKCDPFLYKNFSYYNQTVFDFVLENNGSAIVLGGGGRYDDLSRLITGKNIPAVGFYLNLDLIFQVLKQRALHNPEPASFSVYLCSQSDDMEMMMLQIISELHALGVKTILGMDNEALESQIKKAKQNRCSVLLSLREDHIRDGKILMHNLAKEHHEYVPLTQMSDAILVARKALNNI